MERMTHVLNDIAEAWWTWVVEASWQAALVAGVAVLVVMLGRRLPAPLRYGLLLVALLKFVVPPALPAPTGLFSTVTREAEVEQPVIIESSVSPAAVLVDRPPATPDIETVPTPEGGSAAVALPAAAAATAAPTPRLTTEAGWLLLAAAGTLLALAWIVGQLLLLQRAVRDARPAPADLADRFAAICKKLGLRRVPELLVTDDDVGPSAFGIRRRRVLMPSALTALTEREVTCVLAHEAAHHRRGDLLVNAGAWIVQALWWFHPLVWMTGRSIRRVREECCDDLLLANRVASEEEYCRTLLRTAAFCAAQRHGALAAGIGRHPLGRRFVRIMDGSMHRSARLSAIGLTVLALIGGLVLPGVDHASTQEEPAASGNEITFSGRVVDPEGRPYANARLLLTNKMDSRFRLLSWRSVGRSGDDGTFKVRFDVDQLDIPKSARPAIVAVADGYGIAWFRPGPAIGRRGTWDRKSVADITLTLSKDVPATGRILDLQGEPIAGVSVRPVQVMASTDGKLDTWLDLVKVGKARAGLHLKPRVKLIEGMGTCEAATTDKDGRFAIHGLGADRVVYVFIEGEEVETTFARLVTRKVGKLGTKDTDAGVSMGRLPDVASGRLETVYHGIPAELFIAPTRPIVGRVTNGKTGKPVAGIRVEAMARGDATIFGITDEDGRYRLTGLPVRSRAYIVTKPELERRYVQATARIPAREGAEPVTIDLKVYRGVRVTGRVTDAQTKEPIRAVNVFYTPMGDNPNRRLVLWTTDGWTRTDRDGRFSVLALHGEGVVAIFNPKGYLALDQQEGGEKIASLNTDIGMSLHNMAAAEVLDLADNVETRTCTFALRRGKPFDVRIVDAAGKPVTGVKIWARSGRESWDKQPVEGDRATLENFNPKHPRMVLAAHEETGQVGRLVLDHEGGPAIVMTAGGALKGRLVDVDGLPKAGVKIGLSASGPKSFYIYESAAPFSVQTDKDGRFSIRCLDPRLEYRVTTMPGAVMSAGNQVTFLVPRVILEKLKVTAGELRDIGDVRGKKQ